MLNKKSIEIDFNGISLNGKRFKDWSPRMQEAFIEGFQSNTLSSNNYKGVYGANIDSSSSSSKSKSSSKDFDDKNGHWITTKNGNHVFIEDEKGGKKSSFSKNEVKNDANNKSSFKKSPAFPSKSARSKDSKPIAGAMRGKPMSFEEAGGNNVNPHYNDSDAEENGYRNNCQSCVAVFEARMRGYDIEAKPFDEGNETMKRFRLHPNNAFYNSKTGKEPEIKHGNNVYDHESLRQWLNDEIKPKERHALIFYREKQSGHILIVGKNKHGEFYYYDPQSGESGDDIGFLEKTIREHINLNNSGKNPGLFRTDNLELNLDYLNEIAIKH